MTVDPLVRRHLGLSAHPQPRCPSDAVEDTAVVDSLQVYLTSIFINRLIPSLFSDLDTARWFAFLTGDSEPPSRLGCDSDRRLHIWVNVAVIGKRSRCGEGEHEGLILGEIARCVECSVIACHCMWGITHVGPHNLRSRLDRQCCRIKHVHIIFLDDLHLGHRGSCAGCSCSGWTWRRLRRSSRRGSRCCSPTTTCS